jgi:hypothetical protein
VAPAPPPPPPSRDTNANLDKAFTASAGLPVNGRNVAALGDFQGSLPAGQKPMAKTPTAEAKAQPVAPKTQASADSQYAVNSYPADEAAFAQKQTVEMNAAPVPQAAPQTPAQQSEMMTKVQSRAKAGLFHEVRPIESVITGTEWQITREGELQRSFSRGNLWETMLKGSQFRSVAVVRDHIWAGGDDGSLSFSADNGRNWNPMPVHAGQRSAIALRRRAERLARHLHRRDLEDQRRRPDLAQAAIIAAHSATPPAQAKIVGRSALRP